jgi:hypothetical protein
MRTQKTYSDLTPKGKFPKRDHIGLMPMTPSNHKKGLTSVCCGNLGNKVNQSQQNP